MLALDYQQLLIWLNTFLWPFARVAALVGSSPILGESTVPVRVKIGISVFITLIISPTLPTPPAISPASYTGLWIVAQQILIGLAMGLTMRIVFAIVQTAGEFVGLQMGLAFASFFDPATGANTAVLARLLNVVASLLFVVVNGHLILIMGLAHSFEILPIGLNTMQTEGFSVLFEWSTQIMLSGMLLALPLIIVLLTISLALGILNRTAQQLSVFAVGFPISLTVGFILLIVVLPQTQGFLNHLFTLGFEAMDRLLQALASR